MIMIMEIIDNDEELNFVGVFFGLKQIIISTLLCNVNYNRLREVGVQF